VYNVKTTFISRFGKLPVYWFAIICAFISAMVLDIAIITLRVTFFPKDADVFAELEKDPLIKARFEEEAASELQQSWNRGKPNNDDEIQALLDRPRNLEEGNASTKQWTSPTKTRASDSGEDTSRHGGDISGLEVMDVERRGSVTHTGMDEEIARRFGAVIRKPFRRLPTSE
jgi:phospholipid-translocating ATPase